VLNDVKVRNAKPGEKPYKLADAGSLYLLVTPAGAKLWRWRYYVPGRTERADAAAERAGKTWREKTLALGAYPAVSLKEARQGRDAARLQLDQGVDPVAVRRTRKIVSSGADGNTFGEVARAYYDQHARAKRLSESTKVRDGRILDKLIGRLGERPLLEIETPELLAALRGIESGGHYETTHRALGLARRIWEYAIATGQATRDASSGLGKAIAPVTPASHPAITDPKALGELLRKIDEYDQQPATVAALKLLPLVFCRPGELRLATWSEVSIDYGKRSADDLEQGQWVIPADRTKLRREHLVPLADQAVAILRELYRLTGRGELVFPSLRPGRPLSENTLNVALRSLGYDGKTHVAHGFRSTASTLLHELGFAPDVIETQLAHKRPGVAGIYNRSHRLEDRRTMMQAWADYLDQIKTGKNVVAIGRAKKGRRPKS
jgi:integrase